MSKRIPRDTARRIGNAVLNVPNEAPREGEVRYREPNLGTQPNPFTSWCQWHAHHLSGIGLAGISAAFTHPLVAALAVIPFGFLAAVDAERAVNNARVRAQRPRVEDDVEQAAPAGRAVAA